VTEEKEGKAGPGATLTLTAGGGGLGLVVGWMADPAKGLEVLKWLNGSIGSVGLVLILTMGAGTAVSVAGNWLMWNRLKEKDEECQREMEATRERWSGVVEKIEAAMERRMGEARTERDRIADIVGDLTTQVTLLAERAGSRHLPTRLPG